MGLVLRKEISYLALALVILTDLSPEQALNRLCPPRLCPGIGDKLAAANEAGATMYEMRQRGMGYADIGRQFGITRGSVYRRIQQYKKRLERAKGREG